jgi:4-hydroxybenzoate polyprenyltransferase/phosphoserine phosphatase
VNDHAVGTSTSGAICVDLDGTLIRSDLLVEAFLTFARTSPAELWRLPLWLLRGKAALKAELAMRVRLDVATLPYDLRLLDWLRQQKAAGRRLVLSTASNYRLARAVADHLGIFDEVLASTDDHNLSGRNKAADLERRFGRHGFDYCGNDVEDVHVWKVAHGAVIVNAASGVERAARTAAQRELAVFPRQRAKLRDFVRALRPHQWTKNVLVFVPLLTSHQLESVASITAAVWAFFAFGLCASAVYVVNDLLDLSSDRLHARKRTRPFAAGTLKLSTGFALVPLLLGAAAAVAWRLPPLFGWVLAGYFALTLAYSVELKRIAVVDAMTLAGLYTSRIVAGACAIGVPLSFWLLQFSIFLFLSLAMVKRYAELDDLRRAGRTRASGRGYRVDDLTLLHSFGTAAGYGAVLVLALYINSPEVKKLYGDPEYIWALCVLLLYWISRVWIKTHRGEMHDDPVVYALKDRVSQLVGVLCAAIVYVAL